MAGRCFRTLAPDRGGKPLWGNLVRPVRPLAGVVEQFRLARAGILVLHQLGRRRAVHLCWRDRLLVGMHLSDYGCRCAGGLAAGHGDGVWSGDGVGLVAWGAGCDFYRMGSGSIDTGRCTGGPRIGAGTRCAAHGGICRGAAQTRQVFDGDSGPIVCRLGA